MKKIQQWVVGRKFIKVFSDKRTKKSAMDIGKEIKKDFLLEPKKSAIGSRRKNFKKVGQTGRKVSIG